MSATRFKSLIRNLPWRVKELQPTSTSALAARYAVPPAYMRAALARLDDEGMIERCRPGDDPDGPLCWRLTEAGEAEMERRILAKAAHEREERTAAAVDVVAKQIGGEVLA